MCQTSENSESGVMDGDREGKTGIDLEWLAPLKIRSAIFTEFYSYPRLSDRRDSGAGDTMFGSGNGRGECEVGECGYLVEGSCRE